MLLHLEPVATPDLTDIPGAAVGDAATVDFSSATDRLLDATPPLPMPLETDE